MMNDPAATTAVPPETPTTNLQNEAELPDVVTGGVRIPHSNLDYERHEAARRADMPLPEPLDEEEVFEYEQPNSHLSATPLDQQFLQPYTPSRTVRDYAAQVAAAHQAPRCQHVKASGIRCQAPALRGCDYCYFHKRLHLGPRLIYPTLTQLEDAHGIQNAIMEVLTGILELRIDSPTAGRLLYGLAIAASNLKRLNEFHPDEVVTEEPAPDRTQDGIFPSEPGLAPGDLDAFVPDEPGGAGLQACNSDRNNHGASAPEVCTSAAKAGEKETASCRAEALLHPRSMVNAADRGDSGDASAHGARCTARESAAITAAPDDLACGPPEV